MEKVREMLRPLTDWLPAQVRETLPVEAWWSILVIAGLVGLIIVVAVLRGVGRLLFGWTRRREIIPPEDVEQLEGCPLPSLAPTQIISIYHLPARIRFVVVAPAGTVNDVSRQSCPTCSIASFPDWGRSSSKTGHGFASGSRN